MADLDVLLRAVCSHLDMVDLTGMRALVTSGPTCEAFDGVRFLSNRSSGRQGHAIAEAFSFSGADTYLVRGPVGLADPIGVHAIAVESAEDMLTACRQQLPVDVVVCAAAVSDWRLQAESHHKRGKWEKTTQQRHIVLQPTVDVLATLAGLKKERPKLVIGFAAQWHDAGTKTTAEHVHSIRQAAEKKRQAKGCDWIILNDIGSEPQIMGGDDNRVTVMTSHSVENWKKCQKKRLPAASLRRLLSIFSARIPPMARGVHEHEF